MRDVVVVPTDVVHVFDRKFQAPWLEKRADHKCAFNPTGPHTIQRILGRPVLFLARGMSVAIDQRQSVTAQPEAGKIFQSLP